MNVSDRADQFQTDNRITVEDGFQPAATFAYGILDKLGNLFFDPNRSRASGLTIQRLAKFVFDPSALTQHRTVAAHTGLLAGLQLPNKAIITGIFYDVVTTFTSAADTATIALKVQAANDIVSAIAIGDASNPWDAGLHGTILGYPNFGADAAHDTALEVAALYAGSYLKLTAARDITATVAVQALTAGKLVGFVSYVVSQ